jgi:hypothetical protein
MGAARPVPETYPRSFPERDSGPGCSARNLSAEIFEALVRFLVEITIRATEQTTAGSFTFIRLDSVDRRILQHPGEPCITAPRPQNRHAQPLDLLHCTGSIAGEAEGQPEIETSISGGQDQDIAHYAIEGRNTPAILAPMVNDDGLHDLATGLIVDAHTSGPLASFLYPRLYIVFVARGREAAPPRSTRKRQVLQSGWAALRSDACRPNPVVLRPARSARQSDVSVRSAVDGHLTSR